MTQLLQDLRYGARMLLAAPGFTIVAVLSLAIGIGANSAIFSFADALLFRPLPVARPGDVFSVGATSSFEALNASSLVASYRDYVDIRDRSKSFDGLAAFTNITVGFTADPRQSPKLKMGMLASANLLPLMGIEPVLGRSFTPEEDRVPARDAVIVLGHTLWEQEFGSDPGVLGRTVRLNGIDCTVVGVTPGSFTGMDQYVRSDFFVPLMMSPVLITDKKTGSLEARDARNLTIKGRLRSGVSQTKAQAELTTIGADLARAYPETNKNRTFAVRTELQARIAEDPPDAMLIAMLSTLALGVLLVACGNVAGLLTSRAPVRAREMALRLAIGAGRGRLVRQLITESLIVAVAGGVLGLGIGYAGMLLFRQIEIPTDLPITLAFQMDRRALFFGTAVALVSAVIFGIVPAIQASRTDLMAVMKASDAVKPGRRRRWGRSILVAGQVAVSVILLVVAMFMYRGFGENMADGPGYRTDHLLMMNFDPSLVHYSEAQSQRFFDQVAERAREVAGVTSVTMTSGVPMSNDSIRTVPIAPEGFQFPEGKESVTVMASMVDEHYFSTIGIPVLQGRDFRRDDDENAPRVAVVNQHLAQHYWPNQNPLGKRFRVNDGDRPWVEIIGVARMSKYIFIAEAPSDFVYMPYRQRKPGRMFLLAQSAGDSAALAAPLRDVVRNLDVNLPIYNVRTMEQLYRMRAVAIFNVLITMVAAMGIMGLALAIVGLYGLVAYAATRRTREIGIRMAIGATRATVLSMVMRQGLLLVIVGLAVGLVASIGAGRLLDAAFPSGEQRQDIVSLLLVAPVVLAVTLLAAYVPARRASRINPTEALRYD
jgi:predicted permease